MLGIIFTGSLVVITFVKTNVGSLTLQWFRIVVPPVECNLTFLILSFD